MKISASIYSTTRDLEQVVRELDAHRIDLFHVDCNDDPKVFDDIAKSAPSAKRQLIFTLFPQRQKSTFRY